jgi:dipeptidyl aminopeptidase/acylaminoacyl peptidase
MKRVYRIILLVVGGLLLLAAGGVFYISQQFLTVLTNNPLSERKPFAHQPSDYQLEPQDISLKTADGLTLSAWYLPSQNHAVVIVQHGYKSNRGEMLDEAAVLVKHGYGVLLIDLRGHGKSEGQLILFGKNEVQDVDAGYQFLLKQPDVDPERIGILGNSMGGAISILYAAQNPKIRAVVTDSAFSSLDDTVSASLHYFTGLPDFPFSTTILNLAEVEYGFDTNDIAATEYIDDISPRPVFLMQGGSDTVVSVHSGERLYEAAKNPKELWFDPALDHVQFLQKHPAEFETRVINFFNNALLAP